MSELSGDVYEHYSGSCGSKKWISATAVADYGDSQAMILAPTRRNFIALSMAAAMLLNRSGSTAIVGFGVRYRRATWTAGQVTAAGAFTDDTADAQESSAGDFLMHDRTSSGSGFYLSANERFNTIAFVQAVAGDQVTPVLVLEYWDGATWVDISATCFIADTLIGGGTGEKLINFPMPFPWVVGGSGAGVPATKYNLRCRFTSAGAGSANPTASQLWIGFCKLELVGVPSGSAMTLAREHPLRFPRSGDALYPLISVASAANYAEADVAWYA